MTMNDDDRFASRDGADDDEPGPSSPGIDFEDDEDLDEDEDADEDAGEDETAEAEPEPDEFEDDDENGAPRSEAEGNVREDGVGRAAAVLKYIVERIVDEPDQISIGAAEDDRGPVLLLKVAEDDRGKVIGRQGRIVQAIRTVVKAATVGTGDKVSVEIID